MKARLGLAIALALIPGWTKAPAADGRKPVTPADYGKWETLGAGQLSPDGKWLVHGIARGDGKNELRVWSVDDMLRQAVEFGLSPAFSDDSRWLACEIGVSEDERNRKSTP